MKYKDLRDFIDLLEKKANLNASPKKSTRILK